MGSIRIALLSAAVAGLALLIPGAKAVACSVLLAKGANGEVFGGNNEDFNQPDTVATFLPAQGAKHGVVFFGFEHGWQQGAVNDRGLFFDALALEDKASAPPSGKPMCKPTILERVMRESSTVKDALSLLSECSLPFLGNAQFFFGDRTGDAAIVESGGVVRIAGPFLVATNFRQLSATKPFDDARFEIARQSLAKGPATLDRMRATMAAIHKEGEYPTLYTNIYDLTRGRIYLYQFHEYEHVAVLDIEAELKKGQRAVPLRTLFSRSYAVEAFDRSATARIEGLQKKLDEGAITLGPAEIARILGRYIVKGIDCSINIARTDGKLTMTIEGVGKAVLVPKPSDRFDFLMINPNHLVLRRDAKGEVTGFRFMLSDIEFVAERP